ncbi:MAG: 2-amino-4-hydroxy-6-hydroxymethyldihydropteridine diphosphokinase [Flavobacteriales bacterium]|nr:2-amino-4-hydroxy-6-hydroxymethyldihydropteridine diphosphokinase [Flavobacteriales bacterium]
MELVFISIGTNIGNRSQNLDKCIELIGARIAVPKRVSSYYRSESWGFDAEDFYNAVIEVEVNLEAMELLKCTQGIEASMGRPAKTLLSGYESRLIDIDILTHGDKLINEPGLKIPHPKLSERNFVLMPWSEIAPDLILPDIGKSVIDLLFDCKDSSICEKVEYV